MKNKNIFPKGIKLRPDSALARRLGNEARIRLGVQARNYIDTLIRQKDYATLAKLLGRPPIKGKLGVAQFGQPQPFPGPEAAILEHGMLIFSVAGTTYPLRQYNTDYLTGYLGQGTVIPGQTLQYLIGEATYDGQTTCDDGSPAYTWPPDPAPFTPDYGSVLYTTPGSETSVPPPGLWSGLTLLLAQVCIGAQQSINDIISGTGWQADPNTDGLIRFWDSTNLTYRWWYIKITSANGCQAIELVPSGEGLCPLSWLNGHKQGLIVLNTLDIQYFESWCMKTFQTTGSVQTLLTAQDISGVWNNNALPIAHGWCHSYQTLGTSSEDTVESAICTLWEEVTEFHPDPPNNPTHTHHHAEVHKITYSFAGGNLSASKNAPTASTMHIENTTIALWVPKATGGVTLYFSQLNDPDQNDTTMPVYCFYDEGGTLKTLEYNRHYQYTGTSRNFLWEDTYHCVNRNEGWIGFCADEIGTVWRKNETSQNQAGGGWSIGSVSATEPVGTNGGTFLETKTAQIISVDGERECCTEPEPHNQQPSVSDFLGTNDIWCGSTALSEQLGFCEPAFTCSVKQVKQRHGTGGMTYSIDSYSANSWQAKGAIISASQRDAVYLTQAVYRADTVTQSSAKQKAYAGLATPTCPGDAVCGGYTMGHVEFQFTYTIQDEEGEPPYQVTGGWHSYGMGSCELGDTAACGGTYVPWPGFSAPVPLNQDEDMSAWLVTAHQTRVLTGSWAAWLPFCGGSQGDPDRGWNADLVESYYDGAGWYYTTPSNFNVTDNLPFSPNTHVYVPSGAV